jgi:cholesterol transport system auxiliary component
MMNKILNTIKCLQLFTGVILLSACSVLQPVKSQAPATYTLEAQFAAPGNARGELVLQVSTPQARSGFESPRMVYLKKAHELEYFANNQWVDSPARMIAPLLLQAMESSGKYKAVITSRSAVLADLRLDTEIVRLQQEFFSSPSQLHLTLRVQLLDLHKKSILAQREFDVQQAAASDDPYAGVVAANQALQKLLPQIAEFVGQAGK